MRHRIRSLDVVRPLLVAAALCGCGVEERAELSAELNAARREGADASKEAARLRAEVEDDRVKLLDYRRRADDAAAQEARFERAWRGASDDARRAQDETESKAKDLERVEAHRDELREWIERELLPAAEAGDPKLVNLRETAKEMSTEVEKERGLRFKTPFMRRRLTRDQVVEWMRRDMKKEFPDDEVRKLVAVGEEFGLLMPKTDVRALFTQFMEAGAAAFYKPDTRTFYLIEGEDGRGARPIVFHELVHALEDQYFGLDGFYKTVEKDNDMSLARRGLVEGSACHFAERYERAHPDDSKAMMQSMMTPEIIQKQMKMMTSVPPWLIASYGLYPYKNGPAWLAKIGADDPAAIEKLYRDPPVSTEQVLHPEKFPLDGPRDYPHLIETPDVASILGDGYERLDDNDLGEMTIGVLLTQLQNGGRYMPTLIGVLDMKTQGVGFKGAAKYASEGWDGDRYTAWIEKATGKVVIVWVTVWDGEKDAQEFCEVYGDLLGKRVLGTAPSSRPTPVRYADHDGRISGLHAAGEKVVVVLDAPPDKADALFGAGAAAKVTADPRDPNDRNEK